MALLGKAPFCSLYYLIDWSLNLDSTHPGPSSISFRIEGSLPKWTSPLSSRGELNGPSLRSHWISRSLQLSPDSEDSDSETQVRLDNIQADIEGP